MKGGLVGGTQALPRDSEEKHPKDPHVETVVVWQDGLLVGKAVPTSPLCPCCHGKSGPETSHCPETLCRGKAWSHMFTSSQVREHTCL